MKVFANGYGLVDFRITHRETNEGIEQVNGEILVPNDSLSQDAGNWIAWSYWYAKWEVFITLEEHESSNVNIQVIGLQSTDV